MLFRKCKKVFFKDLVHNGVKSLKEASKNIEIAPKSDMDYSSTFAKS